MKRFAYKFENGKYEKTNKWEVYRGRNTDPHRWCKMVFYSTHRKIENRKRMKYMPPTESKTDYFSYVPKKGETVYEGSEPSLTHETVQDIISELKEITFVIKKKGTYKIFISDSEIEETIHTTNGDYRVDILFKFEKSEPESLVLQWNGTVAVEIWVKHETELPKVKDLHSIGIPILEVKVSEAFYINEDREITEAEINKRKEDIKQHYSKFIYANLLKDYYSEEYLNMVEIEELKKKVEELSKQNIQQNNELQKYKVYSNSLKEENNNMIRQINEKDSELSILKSENGKFRNSFWYRLYKIWNQ